MAKKTARQTGVLRLGQILGKRITNKQAVEANAEFKKIKAKHGRVTAKRVVEWATPKTSPLHKHFQWDLRKAAASFRVEQARVLLRQVQIVVVNLKQEPVKINAWVSTVDQLGRHHDEATKVLSHRETRRLLVAEAFKTLQAFKRQYDHLVELSEVFEAFERAKRKLIIKAA